MSPAERQSQLANYEQARLASQFKELRQERDRLAAQLDALRTALERLLTWRESDFDQPADIAREALALTGAPSALMTVQEARRRNICRICGQPATTPLTLNYGDEFAHTACLNEAATTRPARSSADDCAHP